MKASEFSTTRYFGLDCAGAKNNKTTLAILEHYTRERKVFLLDILDHIGPSKTESGDVILLRHLSERIQGNSKLGVNVPTTLPPCLPCSKNKEHKKCTGIDRCPVPAVKWMRQYPDSTPYTQRPIELWIKYEVLNQLDARARFDIDETMGGNRAPLTARMIYLQKHLERLEIIEALPKLTIATLTKRLKIPMKTIQGYRQIEKGPLLRRDIVESICEHFNLFIYEKDAKKISQHLNSFDAFICALTALLKDQGECEKPPRGFPAESGWTFYPKF